MNTRLEGSQPVLKKKRPQWIDILTAMVLGIGVGYVIFINFFGGITRPIRIVTCHYNKIKDRLCRELEKTLLLSLKAST